MPLKYSLIKAQTLVSTTSYIEFTAIPAGFSNLKILVTARNSTADTGIIITFNSSTSNYVNQRAYGVGTGTVTADTSSTSNITTILSNAGNATSTMFSNGEINILRYAEAVPKQVITVGFTENIATTAYGMITTSRWSDNNAITTIKLTSNGGDFQIGSTFDLYGI